MILLDPRDGPKAQTSKEIQSYIRKMNVMCDRDHQIEYGDAAFEGNGPEGRILIGVERKTLSDLMNCIEDARYSDKQKQGMKKMYKKSYLMVEGEWGPSTGNGDKGLLMEKKYGKWSYFYYRNRPIAYSTVYRYLLSVGMCGVDIQYAKSIEHTAQNLVEMFHYWQKKWANHTAMLDVHHIELPQLMGKPKLVRKWASDIEGLGIKYSLAAAKIFKTPIKLATSDEMDWLKIDGIGVATAQKIVREINGIDR